MAELSGKSAKIRYASIAGTSSTDNAATITTGAGTGNSFVQINATGRRHWDNASTAVPSLWLNSTLVPANTYEVNYVQGKFEFNESRTSTGTYTIDCHFLTSTYLTGGQEWNATVDVDMLETTSFSTSTGDQQWRTFIPGLSQAQVSIGRLVSTGDTGPVFYDRLNLENDVLVELVVDDAVRLEGYGYVQSDGWNVGVDGLTVESVDIQIDGELHYSTT